MCWNLEISLLSCGVAWCACLYLAFRKRSERDLWYATYLFTFTFTQLLDIFFWTQHSKIPGGLKECSSMKEQFSLTLPADTDQHAQYLVSKFVIPLVVFSQHCVQLAYPSPNLKKWRTPLTLLHAIPLIFGMAFQFACTHLGTSKFPSPHDTLIWGGHSAETWQVLAVVGIVFADFWFIIPELSVRLAHCGVFLVVVSTLWVTEGTLSLGSKWCTYCLIFSAVYVSEPLWGPPAAQVKSGKKGKNKKTN